jgi:hypothetical protein
VVTAPEGNFPGAVLVQFYINFFTGSMDIPLVGNSTDRRENSSGDNCWLSLAYWPPLPGGKLWIAGKKGAGTIFFYS